MWYPSLSPKSIQYPFPRIKGEDPLELFCVIFVLCMCVYFFFLRLLSCYFREFGWGRFELIPLALSKLRAGLRFC